MNPTYRRLSEAELEPYRSTWWYQKVSPQDAPISEALRGVAIDVGAPVPIRLVWTRLPHLYPVAAEDPFTLFAQTYPAVNLIPTSVWRAVTLFVAERQIEGFEAFERFAHEQGWRAENHAMPA